MWLDDLTPISRVHVGVGRVHVGVERACMQREKGRGTPFPRVPPLSHRWLKWYISKIYTFPINLGCFLNNRNNQNVFKTKDSENMIVWRKKSFCLTLPQPRGKVRQTWEIKGVKWDTPITHDHNTFEVMLPFYFEAPHFISHFPLHRPLAIVVKYSCIDFSGLSQFTPWAGVKWDKHKQKS